MSPGAKKALKERFVEFELQYAEAGINRSTASVDYDLTDISETATNFNYIICPNIYAYFSRPERRALERFGYDVKKYLR